MSAPVICVTPETRVDESMALMTDRRIRHAPVVDDGELVGMISIGDLVKFISKRQSFQIQYLTDYISAARVASETGCAHRPVVTGESEPKEGDVPMPRIALLTGSWPRSPLRGSPSPGSPPPGRAGSVYTYKSTMTSGIEVPKPKGAAGAKGVFAATVTENGSTRLLKWKLTYSGLTGKAIGAHVHKGKAGVAGAVLVPLCGPCTSGKTGQVKISKDVADLFERHLVYVNVHTNKNQAGEIRGQLKLIGEHESAAGTGASTQPGTTAPATTTDGGYYPGY